MEGVQLELWRPSSRAIRESGGLVGIWRAGRGRGSRRSRAGAPGLLCSLSARPWGVTAARGLLVARASCHLQLRRLHVALGASVLADVLRLAVGTLVGRAGYKPSARGPGASGDRLSTEEEKVRFYVVTQALFLFARNC